MKLHQIIISLLFAIVVLSSYTMWLSEGNEIYGITDYDNGSQYAEFTDKLDTIADKANETATKLEAVKANPYIPDVVGIVFVGAISGVSTMIDSIDVFVDMSFSAVEMLPIGELKNTLLVVVITSLLVAFFIGILAHVMRQSDRL